MRTLVRRGAVWASGAGLIAIALLCCVACGPGDPSDNATTNTTSNDNNSNNATTSPTTTARDKLRVRVATYNVQRLFDERCDSGNCGANSFEAQPSADDYQARLDEVAAAIESLDADIVLLQEIEKEASLQALNMRLAEPYPVVVFGETGRSASLDVGVLARGELLEVLRHGDSTISRPDGSSTSFAREFLEVRLSFQERQIHAFAAHFTSKSSDDPGRRLGEAREAADIALRSADEGGDFVVIGGDLNDDPGSAPIEAMLERGMTSLAGTRSLDEVWTYQFNGEKKRLDYLMVIKRDSMTLLPQEVESRRDPLFRGLGGSDHAALRGIVELD